MFFRSEAMTRQYKSRRTVWAVNGGGTRRRRDLLATEEPLQIELRAGGEQRTAAITMRTPGADYDLAAGFLYAEGVICSRHEVANMRYCVDGVQEQQQYNLLAVSLRHERLPELVQLERYFFINSACGVCGKTMLDDLAERELPPLSTSEEALCSPELLHPLPARLRDAQRIFDETGGLHAAALFDLDGKLLTVREDVGRHNALDKLIGWGLRNNQLPFTDKIIMVSGRASYELLHKCRVAGAPIFCAISAPSSLAVELADHFGVTLVGFLRDDRFNIYTHPARIGQPQQAPTLAVGG